MTRVPHPIPYQGSKRLLAKVILDHVPGGIRCLVEPFAGSAATTLAAASRRLAERYWIGDSLGPLVEIWKNIIERPLEFADDYERIWEAQRSDPRTHYLSVRRQFNEERQPAQLLYLLARCVKNAVRFSSSGEFNQSADHRRSGMHPKKMRHEIRGASALLRGKTEALSGDYQGLLEQATANDLVYMDPPYQGVSDARDPRYFQQLDFDRLMASLDRLNIKNVPFLLSFDGTCGTRTYGKPLPEELHLRRVLIHTGKSSQATLNGEDAETVESLYVSPAIRKNGSLYYSVAASEVEDRQLSLLA
jgi:DNA adenine methylase